MYPPCECVEGVQKLVLTTSSDPGLPPVISLPRGGCLILTLVFFHYGLVAL